jgi:hypothetical protein
MDFWLLKNHTYFKKSIAFKGVLSLNFSNIYKSLAFTMHKSHMEKNCKEWMDIILSSSCVNIVHTIKLAKWTLGQVFFFFGFGPPNHAKTQWTYSLGLTTFKNDQVLLWSSLATWAHVFYLSKRNVDFSNFYDSKFILAHLGLIINHWLLFFSHMNILMLQGWEF